MAKTIDPSKTRYVPLADEARRFGLSDEWFRRAGAAGRIRIFKMGKRLLLLEGAADALLQEISASADEAAVAAE